MAITALGPTFLPNFPISDMANQPAMSVNSAALSLNGSGRIALGIVCYAPKAGTLDGVEVYSGFVSSPSSITASFQDVNSSGLPDGTPDQSSALASPSTGWNVWTSMTGGGGTKRTVTQGEPLAIVLKWTSTQSGQFWVYSLGNNGGSGYVSLKWATDTGAGFAASGDVSMSSFVLRYDDGTYAYVGTPQTCWPFISAATHTFNSGSTPDERGIIWTPPVTVQVSGLWLQYASGGNACDFVLYDSGSSVIETISPDPDMFRGTGSMLCHLQFATSRTLTGGSTYRLVAKPGGSNVSLYSLTANAAAILGALSGGTALHGTSRTDAGAWTNTTTQRYMMGFMVSGVDTSGGGGGGGGSYAFIG